MPSRHESLPPAAGSNCIGAVECRSYVRTSSHSVSFDERPSLRLRPRADIVPYWTQRWAPITISVHEGWHNNFERFWMGYGIAASFKVTTSW